MKLQNDVGRSCGGCNACCKTFPVPEVGKQDSAMCKHCDIGVGCKIYDSRPDACKLFACMWLNGTGGDSFRPDRLGVMLDCQDRKIGEREIGLLHFWEMRKGALEQPMIRTMAERNKDIGFVVVFHYMVGDNNYDSRYQIRKRLFSDEEVRQITQTR